MEGGAVGRLGGRGPRRVLGCDHEGGPIMDGDRELRREAAAWRRFMPSSRAGAPPTVIAWSVCRTAGHRCAAAATRVVGFA